MKKNVIIALLLMIPSLTITAQVGINTRNPQGVFNVDGQKNNPQTGVPTAAQQGDDVVVTKEGRLGIGTISPTVKLEVNNGTTAGAIKIVDGTQAEGKILVSDANGVGTWRNTTGASTVIESSVGAANINLTSANFTYTGASATVTTPGTYLISPRFIFDKGPAGCSELLAYNLSTTRVLRGHLL